MIKILLFRQKKKVFRYKVIRTLHLINQFNKHLSTVVLTGYSEYLPVVEPCSNMLQKIGVGNELLFPNI